MWPRIRSVGDTRCATGVGPSFDDLAVLKGTYARPLIYTGSWTPPDIAPLPANRLEGGADSSSTEAETGVRDRFVDTKIIFATRQLRWCLSGCYGVPRRA